MADQSAPVSLGCCVQPTARKGGQLKRRSITQLLDYTRTTKHGLVSDEMDFRAAELFTVADGAVGTCRGHSGRVALTSHL